MSLADIILEYEVLDQLRSAPRFDPAAVVVATYGGVVTLTGSSRSYGAKCATLRAAARAPGCRLIEDHITVVLPAESRRADADIARDIATRFHSEMTVPEHRVQVRVEDGWVHLDGTTDWQYQQLAAEEAVESIAGVRGISNRITLAHETACPTFGHPCAASYGPWATSLKE